MIFVDLEIEKLADRLQAYLKDYSDCLHIASAALSNCSCLVTCDKELLRKARKIESFLLKQDIMLRIVNVVKFINILSDKNGS